MDPAAHKFETAHRLMRQSNGGDNLERAAHLMKEAADLGHAGAANNYGAMVQHGRGVEPDLAEARTYYAQAAKSG
ncbi:MAG: hypothetical protein AAFV37_10615, partial [Pseudomonadota bacterium]